VSILWYDKFTPPQKSIVSDFLTSLTGATTVVMASVGRFGTIEQLYLSNVADGASTHVLLDQQAFDESLTLAQIEELSVRVGGDRKCGLFTFLDTGGGDGRRAEQSRAETREWRDKLDGK
jgi:hypothetical protein